MIFKYKVYYCLGGYSKWRKVFFQGLRGGRIQEVEYEVGGVGDEECIVQIVGIRYRKFVFRGFRRWSGIGWILVVYEVLRISLLLV